MGKHEKIQNIIGSDELASKLSDLFQKSVEQEGCSPSKFRQAFDGYLKSLISSKGKTVEDTSEIKAHFCRGRKWVIIPKEHELFEKFEIKAQDEDMLELVELWKSHEQAWVRFHSTRSGMVNFSLHENSSVASGIKLPVLASIALALDVLDGTPKSLGLETRKAPELEEVDEEEADEVADDNARLLEERDEELAAFIEAEENAEVIEENVEELEGLEDLGEFEV